MTFTDALYILIVVFLILTLVYAAGFWFFGSCGKCKNTKKIQKHVTFQLQQPLHMCEAKLNRKPKYFAEPSEPINDRPGFVDFPTSCPHHPKPNPELAEQGTGVGEPAFEDINEFPAPFKPQCKCKQCSTPSNDQFNPSPSDAHNEIFGNIDYKITPPSVSGFVCKRPSGIGEPAFEKKNEFPASFSRV